MKNKDAEAVHNNYYDDYTTAGIRIGRRIRKIRNFRELSQGELGEKVGLSADRIQKYENGVRTPRPDMLKKIADALEVNVLALADPVISGVRQIMYALFELESLWDLRIIESDNEFGNGRIYLSFGDGEATMAHPINLYLQQWARAWRKKDWEMINSSPEEWKKSEDWYNLWKWTWSGDNFVTEDGYILPGLENQVNLTPEMSPQERLNMLYDDDRSYGKYEEYLNPVQNPGIEDVMRMTTAMKELFYNYVNTVDRVLNKQHPEHVENNDIADKEDPGDIAE